MRSNPFTVALAFLEPSLRTRVSFAAAAVRLGGTAIDVDATRWSPSMSSPETIRDTLRVVSGMADIVVVRSPDTMDESLGDAARSPIINGGDGGERSAHPTQALVDLAAIERFAGPVDQLRIGICGDLGTRSARSLVGLLGRFRPRSLALMAPTSRSTLGIDLHLVLDAVTTWSTVADFSDLDVVYLTGLPEHRGADQLGVAARSAFALTDETATELQPDAVVLAPGPIIDEIAPNLRTDRRVKVFEQGDHGVAVRAALLDLLLDT